MLLHHLVTIFLYGFSYLGNFTVAGVIVTYLHDIADIFTCGVQSFSETKYEMITVGCAIGMLFSWFYTRIYVYPIVVY